MRDFVDAHAIDAVGGFTVGSPTQAVDDLQSWVEQTDVDGFNLANVITQGSFGDFITYVVPELQRRGLYKTSYQEGTVREMLFGAGPGFPKHTARRGTAALHRR